VVPKPKDIVSRHTRTAVLILVFYLALFVLSGSLLSDNGIFQWNWVIQVALAFLIASGISLIISTFATFKIVLEPTNPSNDSLDTLSDIAGRLFSICFFGGNCFLIAAIWF